MLAEAVVLIPKSANKGTEIQMDVLPLVLCKDCDHKECWGRGGDVVCGIDGTPHRPDWFCADGEQKEGR